ncbi:MAG: Fic family protein [Flavobacteriaceae bacterium]|nr:Fic family protein [Flavobacteriaceae bacterium]
MTIIDKLILIQKQGGFTQSSLANRLQVSFPTINSWLLGKSLPRKKHIELIESLYEDFFGLETIAQEKLDFIKNQVLSFYDENWNENILKSKEVLETLLLKLTYHSNSIEGSTLTEADTEAILFQQKVIVNRTLIEQLEAINHQKAYHYALGIVRNRQLKTNDILEIHKLLMSGIIESAGEFRNHPVRILGSYVPTANFLSIEKKISELLEDFNNTTNDKIEHIAKSHALFEQIHPFSDGNGRVGRLLMLVMALKYGLPPVLVLQEQKKAYYKYLQEAQLKEDFTFLTYFVANSILEATKSINFKI